jgi:hypothetical protein
MELHFAGHRINGFAGCGIPPTSNGPRVGFPRPVLG